MGAHIPIGRYKYFVPQLGGDALESAASAASKRLAALEPHGVYVSAGVTLVWPTETHYLRVFGGDSEAPFWTRFGNTRVHVRPDRSGDVPECAVFAHGFSPHLPGIAALTRRLPLVSVHKEAVAEYSGSVMWHEAVHALVWEEALRAAGLTLPEAVEGIEVMPIHLIFRTYWMRLVKIAYPGRWRSFVRRRDGVLGAKRVG